MISKLAVKNFQSLSDIQLELAPFTVIVGPSSSGKSATTRALRTLTSNARGDSFVSHGEQTATITAHTDRGIVSLSRGKKNEYTLIDEQGQKKNFTKLAGAVPDEITEALGIPARDPLNYSSQFDMPYLLTSSAGEVARTLGELTNVSVLFSAAREANRQRLQASSTLKTRAGDYEELTKNLDLYRSLKSRQAALNEASTHYAEALGIQGDILTINGLISRIKNSENTLLLTTIPYVPDIHELQQQREQISRLNRLTSDLEAAEASILVHGEQPDIPDLTKLQTALQKLSRLEELFRDYMHADFEITAVEINLTEAEEQITSLQAEHSHILTEAGTCPTCGQNTERIAA